MSSVLNKYVGFMRFLSKPLHANIMHISVKMVYFFLWHPFGEKGVITHLLRLFFCTRRLAVSRQVNGDAPLLKNYFPIFFGY